MGRVRFFHFLTVNPNKHTIYFECRTKSSIFEKVMIYLLAKNGNIM